MPYLAAMANDPTFGDLYKAKAILEADLEAAVEAYMTDPSIDQFAISGKHIADPAAAVKASTFATLMLCDPANAPKSKRSAVRAAILLSKPVKG